MKIALCGCMMQEEGAQRRIRAEFGFVDLVFGTHNIHKFAELLSDMYAADESLFDIWAQSADSHAKPVLPARRKYPFKSGLNIMYGCNNFCSYCIVPYVRGRERSRPAADIMAEAKSLAADGVMELMLLGQNVNSYGLTNSVNAQPPAISPLTEPVKTAPDMDFPALLGQIEAIEGIERIRFMTSHPKDLSDALIERMAASKKICRHLHLPLQSGSSRILEAMNRHYTKEEYLELVAKIRAAMPDIAITTDIIVGFPGETAADLAETMDVVHKAQFENAFTFIYSKRSGTPAATMPNPVAPEVAKAHFARLVEAVQTISQDRAARLLGATVPVLVECVNEKNSVLLSGRLSQNTLVHFAGSKELIGKIIDVRLKESRGFYYLGEKD